MPRIEYWPTSEGVHVVEITPSKMFAGLSDVRLVRVLHCCRKAVQVLGSTPWL